MNQNNSDLTKSIFIKMFLDWYRANGMIDAYAVGGNGGSMAIKYWDFLKFPLFDDNVEKNIASIYHNPSISYDAQKCTLTDFLEYDNYFNKNAGIHEIDLSMKSLQKKLDVAISNIADDENVIITFA